MYKVVAVQERIYSIEDPDSGPGVSPREERVREGQELRGETATGAHGGCPSGKQRQSYGVVFGR